MLNREIPGATCRLQFHHQFTFQQATGILDYLRDLGITDIYASPIFTAGPESMHGYDICAFSELNPALGSSEAFDAFTQHRQKLGLGLLLDMVPNHMGAYSGNPWWTDVLRRGPESPFARHFDIDWNRSDPSLNRKVLLPVLGDRYPEVLRRGEIKLESAENNFFVTYFDQRWPISPESEAELRKEAERLEADLLPYYNESDPKRDRLHRLLQKQHFRLAWWRVGPAEINYRRFFDVTSLIGVRVEDEKVFQEAHKVLFELLRQGVVTGLRIDHPDGLLDPKTYFDRLQENRPAKSRLYVVAEKILSGDERLPADWKVDGTTGYDFLNVLNGIFIDTNAESAFSEMYRAFTGCSAHFGEAALRAKSQVLETLFQGEVNRLADGLKNIAAQTREGVDFTREEIKAGILAFIAAFPVYRTYARCQGTNGEASDDFVPPDAAPIETARTAGIATAPQLALVLHFIAAIQRLELKAEWPAHLREEACRWLGRFQQLTGPATAKGLEDTAFYRFNRFISLNEVGGEPGKFGVNVPEFHAWNSYKQRNWPHALLATATHDTKRGEDLRARLNVLSEIPSEWEHATTRWAKLNAGFKTTCANGEMAPTANDEYFLYQTLAGSWTESSDYSERIQAYLKKAMREAKDKTSWTDPNEEYEKAAGDFAGRVLASSAFLNEFRPLQQRLAFFGIFNSLAQVLLKICSPGVPDLYQGTELWDLSFVDPDNRRPVDYKFRSELLKRVRSQAGSAGFLQHLVDTAESGEIKLFTLWKALQTRLLHRDLFEQGEYLPVEADGKNARHVVAFARQFKNKMALAVVPRLSLILAQGEFRPPMGDEIWGDTRLNLKDSLRLKNIFTGEIVQAGASIGALLRSFPVALLVSEE